MKNPINQLELRNAGPDRIRVLHEIGTNENKNLGPHGHPGSSPGRGVQDS